jgi:small-conductance mechanosensitive channel
MKLLSTMGTLSLILLVGLCLSCGGSSEETPPPAGEATSAESVEPAVDSAVDTAEEAAGDAAADATVDKIKAELADKEAELEKITDELKALSPQDMVGEKGEELKKKSEALSDEIQKLKDKLASLTE